MADQRILLAAELFKCALDRPLEQRAAFLEQKCGGDLELRCEVESLLKFSDDGDEFLEQPAIDIALKSFLQGALKPDQQIGAYKVVSRIGSGGMGEVYLAQDEKLNRRVALKLVRFGIGGEESARRFLREAQLVASLNHPNIAQLYDAEITPDGLSFLIMEYVQGVRVDKYCDNNRLSIRHRLEMFRRVCGAVHYAHQRLIIHRDIKPANILVTKEGEPKLLDFGIAKLLDPEASIAGEQTVTFAAAMTPEYASPEHVRGEAMTTASDIYSLGVLLYELLTGQRPFRVKGRNPPEMARALSEQEPVRPSTVVRNSRFEDRDSADSRFTSYDSRALSGDLDNIGTEGDAQGTAAPLRFRRAIFGRYPPAPRQSPGHRKARHAQLSHSEVRATSQGWSYCGGNRVHHPDRWNRGHAVAGTHRKRAARSRAPRASQNGPHQVVPDRHARVLQSGIHLIESDKEQRCKGFRGSE